MRFQSIHCEKEIKCSTSLVFYLFSPTRLINSIKHERSCKILYFFNVLIESISDFILFSKEFVYDIVHYKKILVICSLNEVKFAISTPTELCLKKRILHE